MSYSAHKKAIRLVEVYLKQMVEGKGRLEFPSEEPIKLSFRLFQGIKTAANFDEYAEYAQLGVKYKIKNAAGKVVCEPRSIEFVSRSQILAQITLPNLREPLQVIGAAIQHKAPVMVFPDAHCDLVPIYNWATKNGYYLIDVEKDGIILTKDEESRELAWKP